jgi:hypothetical protein
MISKQSPGCATPIAEKLVPGPSRKFIDAELLGTVEKGDVSPAHTPLVGVGVSVFKMVDIGVGVTVRVMVISKS